MFRLPFKKLLNSAMKIAT